MGFLSEDDTKDIDLTPEFIVKSDLDIQTMMSIFEYAKKHHHTVVITGGYATEAQLGGRILRAHGDIDCILLKHTDVANDQIFEEVQAILAKEKTDWQFIRQAANKLDCREKRTDIPFNLRRRFELKIPREKWPESEYEPKTLYNSVGEAVHLTVSSLYPLIREKIHKFYEVRNGVDEVKDRVSSLCDVIDLARLLGSENVNKYELLKHVTQEEYEYILRLLNKLSPRISKYLIK
jgi:hypothetical protein